MFFAALLSKEFYCYEFSSSDELLETLLLKFNMGLLTN